jgi:aspartate aminotransferase
MSTANNFPLSDRINALSESQTIAMAKKAKDLSSQGFNVINLSLGEPDFGTPQFIKDAAKVALDEGYTHYSPISGYQELRTAIAKKLREENNLTWKAENVVISTGAKQSIANVVLCLVNPGDEVVVLSPYWVSYLELVKLAEGNPIMVPGTIDNDFKPTAAEIEKAITPKTKLLMFSSPCNPTGSVFNKAEFDAIVALLEKHPNIYVIADEIYEYINYEGKHLSIGSYPSIADRVITVNGFSKGFAMTGWRLGYIGAAKWIADACDKMQGQFTSGTNSIAQRAGLAAIEGSREDVQMMLKAFKNRRDLVLSLVKDIPGIKANIPAGAFYLFPDVTAFYGKAFNGTVINNSSDMSMYLLAEALVSTVPGDAFGDNDCIRFSFAASEADLADAMARIKKALAQLQ